MRRIAWRDALGEHELDLSAPCSVPPAPITLSRDRFQLPLNRSVVRFADAFIVHSRYVAERIREERNAHTPLGILHHGSLDRWRDGDRRVARRTLGLSEDWVQSCLVVSFGGVQAHKRIDKVLLALAAARAQRQDVRLSLAGSIHAGDFDPLRMAQQLGLQDAVRFTGYLSEVAAWDWLHAADFAINLRGPTTGGTSGGIFQAFSVGRAVIASDAAEQKELPGYFVLVDEVDADVARAVVNLNLHPDSERYVTRTPDKEYEWSIRHFGDEDVGLTLFLGTKPTSVEVRDGGLCAFDDKEYVGKYLRSTYLTDDSGLKNVVTLAVPHAASLLRPKLTRIALGDRSSGAHVGFGGGVNDFVLESKGTDPVVIGSAFFLGKAMHCRKLGPLTEQYFVRDGLGFDDERMRGAQLGPRGERALDQRLRFGLVRRLAEEEHDLGAGAGLELDRRLQRAAGIEAGAGAARERRLHRKRGRAVELGRVDVVGELGPGLGLGVRNGLERGRTHDLQPAPLGRGRRAVLGDDLELGPDFGQPSAQLFAQQALIVGDQAANRGRRVHAVILSPDATFALRSGGPASARWRAGVASRGGKTMFRLTEPCSLMPLPAPPPAPHTAA